MNGGMNNRLNLVGRVGSKASWKAGVVIAAGSLALLAGSAFGQGAGFDKPLAPKAASSGGSGGSTTHVETHDGDAWVMTMKDGAVTVKHNDEDVPADRIRQSNGKVEVLDADGDVVKTFRVGSTRAASGQMVRRVRPNNLAHTVPPVPPVPPAPGSPQVWSWSTSGPAPKAMIGITMNEADDEDGIVLERVIDGLPAAQAGLKAGDIIIKIDGKGPATPDSLREVLRAKNGGEEVKVLVKRDGDEKEYTVKLTPFDSQKLGSVVIAPSEPGSDDEDAFAAARKRLEEAMAMLSKNEYLKAGKLHADASKALAEAQEKMQKALAELDEAHSLGGLRSTFNLRPLTPRSGRISTLGNGPFVTMPDNDELSKKLEKVSEQLDQLNERLDRLEKKLDK